MTVTDASLRMAMAELIRQDLEGDHPAVRKVTGYRDDTEVHYPGMSCEWTTAIVQIFYEDYAGEPQSYRYEGDFGALVRRLADITANY